MPRGARDRKGAAGVGVRASGVVAKQLRPVFCTNIPLTPYSAIAVPTLLLIGGASPPRQQPNGEELADVRVERLDGLGHAGAAFEFRVTNRGANGVRVRIAVTNDKNFVHIKRRAG